MALFLNPKRPKSKLLSQLFSVTSIHFTELDYNNYKLQKPNTNREVKSRQ